MLGLDKLGLDRLNLDRFGLKQKNRKVGLPPGSIVFTGKQKVDQIQIHYSEYDEEKVRFDVVDNASIQQFHAPVDELVQWYDVRGLHDTDLIEEFGRVFSVHPLAMEDIADPGQRPKLDEYEGGIFIAAKAISFDAAARCINTEQVTFYLGKGFLLTFQEDADDLFAQVRTRIEKSGGRIRKQGADYLLYALLDYLVDQYFVALDAIEDVIEQMELRIYKNRSPEIRGQLYNLKQELTRTRKIMVPTRELFNNMISDENKLLTETTQLYLRDLRDHQFQALEVTDSYRDNINSLQDLYLSELSFEMNQVMQVLAIVSTIFIPLTFLAGIYGMNFEYIPELQYRYGYFVLLGVMVVVTFGLIYYFRRKRWL